MWRKHEINEIFFGGGERVVVIFKSRRDSPFVDSRVNPNEHRPF